MKATPENLWERMMAHPPTRRQIERDMEEIRMAALSKAPKKWSATNLEEEMAALTALPERMLALKERWLAEPPRVVLTEEELRERYPQEFLPDSDDLISGQDGGNTMPETEDVAGAVSATQSTEPEGAETLEGIARHSGSMSATQSTKLRALAFIALNEVAKGVFRGGVLVTDARGKPLEFRCTSAIQPTVVQKALYGDTLRDYMCIGLTAQPLYDALEEEPSIVLVTQRDFIDFRKFIDIPLLIATKQSTMAAEENPAGPATSKLLDNPSGKFEPVIITCHYEHLGDISSTHSDLADLFSRVNLTEPFSRIENALKLLHEKETSEK